NHSNPYVRCPMNRHEVGALSVAVLLLVGLSGCDWGYNNRYYCNNMAQTESAIKQLMPDAPRKDGKRGWVIYGVEEPVEEPHFPQTNLVVRVKSQKDGRTQVQVKARENHDMIVKQRERDSDVEKAVLDDLGA